MAAQNMIARFAQWQGRDPESLAADATYGNGESRPGRRCLFRRVVE